MESVNIELKHLGKHKNLVLKLRYTGMWTLGNVDIFQMRRAFYQTRQNTWLRPERKEKVMEVYMSENVGIFIRALGKSRFGWKGRLGSCC